MGSYKGDVFSGVMEVSDMNSDVDATNIYNRASDSEEDFFEIMFTYNMEVENGETNRVDEFLKFYGGGDAEKGLEYIKKDLEDVDMGSHYLGAEGGIRGFASETVQNIMLANFASKITQITFDEALEALNEYSVFSKNTDVKETKDEFIKYLEEGMSR